MVMDFVVEENTLLQSTRMAFLKIRKMPYPINFGIRHYGLVLTLKCVTVNASNVSNSRYRVRWKRLPGKEGLRRVMT